MDFSLKKSYKSHNSYKHLRKLAADKSNHGNEHLPMLFPHHHDDSKRAVDFSDHHSHREEVIVKVYDGDSSATKRSEATGGKIWRENSYEFWKDQAKSGFDFVRLGSRSSGGGSGSGQSSNAVAEEEKDPPTKLIFLSRNSHSFHHLFNSFM
ncbi:mechanosensitive ion channel protein 8 [Quercus suber]|uniref:Mechanosensitive ion channel protein 8 n=1 Tax=Quercus suber TaxID=58331 RepID=A0AAW0KJ59_QUESU